MKRILISFLSILFFISPSYSSEKNAKSKVEHEEKSGHDDHDDHDDQGSHEGKEDDSHDEKHAHNEKSEDGHGEEENSQIGPDKGIIAFDEDNGFKLSPEALKNFDLKMMNVDTRDTLTIDSVAIVTVGQEKNLFRFRNGYFKRIDYTLVSKTANRVTIKSKDLQTGDQIVVQGLGFLRISEIAATGGAPEGHSH